ncbi:MAG: DUF3237 domain-containing protein [Acidimicrobiia bacterium]|nr:DUF3237 domain-containing protein [Acidimicrobiia bacterium]
MAIELVPLAVATIGLTPPTMIPNGPYGARIIVEVTSWEMEGERIQAKLRGSAAADWATVTADGTLLSVDVRATVETHDGAAVFVQYNGRSDVSGGFGTRPNYIAPRFETGDERYAWLNKIQAVGKGALSADFSSIEYELYELR